MICCRGDYGPRAVPSPHAKPSFLSANPENHGALEIIGVIFGDKLHRRGLFCGLLKVQLPRREPRNKMMRIGLHGLCRYIKLERGRAGGAKGAYTA